MRKVDPKLGPVSTAVGVLGMPGMTAYTGLLDSGKPVAEIRPTATEAQKQSADSGQAFKDLPSAAVAFDAVLAKITA